MFALPTHATTAGFVSFWSLKQPSDLSKAACSLIRLGQLHCTQLHVFLLSSLCFFSHVWSFFLLWSQTVFLLWQEEKNYYCSLSVLEFWKITYNFCCALTDLFLFFFLNEDDWKKRTTYFFKAFINLCVWWLFLCGSLPAELRAVV